LPILRATVSRATDGSRRPEGALCSISAFTILNAIWAVWPIGRAPGRAKTWSQQFGDMKRSTDNGVALFSEHTRVLLCIYEHPESTVRELAKALQASERQTFRLLSELQQAGCLTRSKHGRRNRYLLNFDFPVEEGQVKGLTLADFLAVLARYAPAEDRAAEAARRGFRVVRDHAARSGR